MFVAGVCSEPPHVRWVAFCTRPRRWKFRSFLQLVVHEPSCFTPLTVAPCALGVLLGRMGKLVCLFLLLWSIRRESLGMSVVLDSWIVLDFAVFAHYRLLPGVPCKLVFPAIQCVLRTA